MAQNVKVVARVRPFLQREQDMGAVCVVSVSGRAVTVLGDSRPDTFMCDTCYWSAGLGNQGTVSQESVVSDIGAPLVENVGKGYNCCVFAYGERSAGKSHTLFGRVAAGSQIDQFPSAQSNTPGLLHWLSEALFKLRARCASKGEELRMWFSLMEIRGERIRDLLHPSPDTQERELVDHPEFGAYAAGLIEAPCSESRDVHRLFDFGMKKRVISGTNLASSPRAHILATLRVQRLPSTKSSEGRRDARRSIQAKVSIVDLAGSECPGQYGVLPGVAMSASCARSFAPGLRGGCAVNHSLAALGLVIGELEAHQSRLGKQRSRGSSGAEVGVPFRSAACVLLLRDALTGNCKTVMVAALSPASTSASETRNTLRLASSVKALKTTPRLNVDRREDFVTTLQAELRSLQQQQHQHALEHPGIVTELGGKCKGLHADATECARLLAELQKPYTQQVEEAKQIDAAREAALQQSGMASADAIAASRGVSHLVNFNSDPLLSSRAMYMLPQGSPVTIGSGPDVDIVLRAPGVPAKLCQVEQTGRGCVRVNVYSGGSFPRAQVRANGAVLRPGEGCVLKHNDILLVGRAMALRLVGPSPSFWHQPLGGSLHRHDTADMDVSIIEEPEAELMLANLDPQDSSAWGELQLYLEDLWQRLDGHRCRELFATLGEVSHLVDEANEITDALRPEDMLRFEVELVWDIHRDLNDIIIVRLLRHGLLPRGLAPAHEKHQHRGDLAAAPPVPRQRDVSGIAVVGYWSVAKFRARLEYMREAFESYHSGATAIGRGDCMEDPWSELSVSDLRHRLATISDINSQLSSGQQVPCSAPSETTRRGAHGLVAGYAPQHLRGGATPPRSVPHGPGRGSSPLARTRVERAGSASRGRGTHDDAQPATPTVPAPQRQSPPPRRHSPPSPPRTPPVACVSGNLSGDSSVPHSGGASTNCPVRPVPDEQLICELQARIRDKQEKEELYKLRIEYLQQQIDAYEQLANRGERQLMLEAHRQAVANAVAACGSPGSTHATSQQTVAPPVVVVPAVRELRVQSPLLGAKQPDGPFSWRSGRTSTSDDQQSEVGQSAMSYKLRTSSHHDDSMIAHSQLDAVGDHVAEGVDPDVKRDMLSTTRQSLQSLQSATTAASTHSSSATPAVSSTAAPARRLEADNVQGRSRACGSGAAATTRSLSVPPTTPQLNGGGPAAALSGCSANGEAAPVKLLSNGGPTACSTSASSPLLQATTAAVAAAAAAHTRGEPQLASTNPAVLMTPSGVGGERSIREPVAMQRGRRRDGASSRSPSPKTGSLPSPSSLPGSPSISTGTPARADRSPRLLIRPRLLGSAVAGSPVSSAASLGDATSCHSLASRASLGTGGTFLHAVPTATAMPAGASLAASKSAVSTFSANNLLALPARLQVHTAGSSHLTPGQPPPPQRATQVLRLPDRRSIYPGNRAA